MTEQASGGSVAESKQEIPDTTAWEDTSVTNSVFRPNGTTLIFQRPAARLSPCRKTNPRSRARQEADVKPRFLTGAAPNLALLFADDAATEESILARKRGIDIKTSSRARAEDMHHGMINENKAGITDSLRYPLP